MKRNVTIAPNLAAWLTAYPISRFPIIPKNLQHQRARIAEKFGLSHDIMRHTFISMHVAKYRSMGEAALQAGNSESIIRKHYLDLKTPAEAEQFFGILPTPVVAVATATVTPLETVTMAIAA
jgi:hypothetical protein